MLRDLARAAALTERRDLLENPPSSFAAWDLHLGHFLLGESHPEEFIAAGQTELQRRLDASENTNDLMCEVYFYAGLWQKIGSGGARVGPGLYYQLALLEHPLRWKWQWAYSRLFLRGFMFPIPARATGCLSVSPMKAALHDGGK